MSAKQSEAGKGRRVLIVGLDMGDGGLIRHWAMRGGLPNFAELIAKGAWSDLDTTAKVLHTSTWPTFATGVNPGRHGVYYPYQAKPGRQLASLIEPDQYGAPTFWRIAAEQGARCIVYDVPETFPDQEFQGTGVFDWGTWAWYGKPAAQPAPLLKELKSKFGPYPLGLEAKRLGLRFPEPKTLATRLLQSVAYKFETFGWLLDRQPWDLAVIGFGETHPGGHYLWPASATSVESVSDDDFAALRHVYQALDAGLGQLRSRLGADDVLMVLSGDGVRTNNCACHLVQPMLEKLGYAVSAVGSPDGRGADQPAGRRSALGRAKRLLPPGAKRWVADHLPWWLRDRLGSQASASEIDWSRTRAFALPTDLEGCIRVNLQGREPLGIVAPGAEYDELCARLREEFQALVNPATGEPAVRDVWVRNEVFPGERQEHLPDVIVTWNQNAPFNALVSPRVGPVEGANPDPRTGTHSPEAFLVIAGPGIPAGGRAPGRLVDVAPTTLRYLGLEPEKRMEGTALEFQPAQEPVYP